MRSVVKLLLVLALVASLVGAVVSCAPAGTAPTEPATAAASDPTAAPAPTEPPAPTAAPTEVAGEPEPADDVPRITIDELKALVDEGAYIAILDVRPKESFELGHIKGATSFPWKPQMTIADVELLPAGDPIVTYCDCGPGEHDSVSVAEQLMALGEEREIMVLSHPAIEGWIEAGYPTE